MEETLNRVAPKKRISAFVDLDLAEEVKELSEFLGVTQQDFVGGAVAYFVQLKNQRTEAELLLSQFAMRHQVHPDSLVTQAINRFLNVELDNPTLGDLASELLAPAQSNYLAELTNPEEDTTPT